jgi:predicted RNA-binding Zn-ribbon protein involved in translation (DUF1610 family)
MRQFAYLPYTTVVGITKGRIELWKDGAEIEERGTYKRGGKPVNLLWTSKLENNIDAGTIKWELFESVCWNKSTLDVDMVYYFHGSVMIGANPLNGRYISNNGRFTVMLPPADIILTSYYRNFNARICRYNLKKVLTRDAPFNCPVCHVSAVFSQMKCRYKRNGTRAYECQYCGEEFLIEGERNPTIHWLR